MKKIVLTAAATLALGLAACTPAADDAGNNAVDTNLTVNEADIDVNGAALDVDANGAAAISSTDNAIDGIGNTAAEGANAVADAAADAANTVANAAE